MATLAPVSSIPFTEGKKYTGEVKVSIITDPKTSAVFIRVIGERITLENFLGQYADRFKEIFGDRISTKRDEIEDLRNIFGVDSAMKNYKSRKAEDDTAINKRIEKDSSRTLKGDVFSGFAIKKNDTKEIIGRASIGGGYIAGESQSAAMIKESERGKGYGREAYCLIAALAHKYFSEKYHINNDGEEAPVNNFTMTLLKDLNITDKIVKENAGMVFLRELIDSEYSADKRDLVGISGDNLPKWIEKNMDPNKVTFEKVTI